MNVIQEPARKLFISQHTYLKRNTENERCKWVIKTKRNSIPVSLVWIQGVVICDTLNRVIIDDGTGVANVFSAKEAPGFGSWLKNGRYVMIVGELLSVHPSVKVKALKITELPRLNSETLWILEVLDYWKLCEKS
ncbi:uncharacterized protein LOC129225060 [Uloborus diversus]|uniref:uncharacterized protein LOC129225060 n=1 Tax=Uloborus diversus TaxID=327109 RepID=UPI002409F621|nr:uncharacterized protein LOC129225060 [Uloborus diversus]